MTDVYDWWRKAKENPAKIGTEEIPVHENEPQCGYFRKRVKGGVDQPAAILVLDGKVVAMVGKDAADPIDLWTWVAKHPVSYDDYKAAMETGQWPNEAAPIGHNRPETGDAAEDLRGELADEVEQAKELLKVPVETKDQADRVGTWATKLVKIGNRADAFRKAEKQPHLDAARQVDERWREIIDIAKDIGAQLKRHLDKYLIEQDRLEKERQKKAAEEAAEAKRRADAAVAAAEAQEDDAAAKEAADRAAADAKRAAEAAKPQSTAAGRTGAKVALKTYLVARIVDYDKAVIALKDHPDMRALVDQLANRAVKKGVAVDGVEAVEEKRAA